MSAQKTAQESSGGRAGGGVAVSTAPADSGGEGATRSRLSARSIAAIDHLVSSPEVVQAGFAPPLLALLHKRLAPAETSLHSACATACGMLPRTHG